jgi:hypothetical protein
MLRYARSAGSPAAIAAQEQMNAEIDIRDILPTIRVPTLVMNRTGDPQKGELLCRVCSSSSPSTV